MLICQPVLNCAQHMIHTEANAYIVRISGCLMMELFRKEFKKAKHKKTTPNLNAVCKNAGDFIAFMKIPVMVNTYRYDARELPDLLRKIEGCPASFANRDVTFEWLVSQNLTSRAVIEDSGLTPQERAKKLSDSAKKKEQTRKEKQEAKERRN